MQHTALHVDAIMEMLEVCLKTSHFRFGDRFFQEKEEIAMGSSLSPVISNIYLELFEKLALDGWDMKPSLWLM